MTTAGAEHGQVTRLKAGHQGKLLGSPASGSALNSGSSGEMRNADSTGLWIGGMRREKGHG